MNKRRLQRSALLACSLLLLVVAVPCVLTWREWRQEHLNRALITALQRNKAQEAMALLEQGADAKTHAATPDIRSFRQMLWDRLRGKPSVVETSGLTTLQIIFAADQDADPLPKRKEPVEIARALIAHGADVNAKDEFEVPVVVFAGVYRGNYGENNLHCVKLLLDAGADVNAETRNGMSLLLCAIKGNNLDMAQLLLSRGAKCQNDGEDVPALQAARRYENHPEMLTLLRGYGYTN